MDLAPFNFSIGISDILNFRECPQRMIFGMRRHLPIPERLRLFDDDRDEPPESIDWTNVYGSAVHHAIHLVTTGASHDDAIDETMILYGTYLLPEDIMLMREDLETFETRRPKGVSLVASERDMRVPLFVADGTQIYFRFKLDALWRLDSNPSVFVHWDYKSSKWRRTPPEIHKDLQFWAYNWGIHEYWPECRHLIQNYDQLRFGVTPTTKNDEQRAAMKQWLIDMVTLIMNEQEFRPKLNDFCRYCPLVIECREPRRATKYTKGRLGLLAPLRKDGRKVRVEFFEDSDTIEELISKDLPGMIRVRKIIEHVEKALKETLGEMPIEDRERLGWEMKDRRSKTITPDGLRELHQLIGDEFYQLVGLTASKLEELYGKPKRGEPVPIELQIARRNTVESVVGTNMVRINGEGE